MPRFRRTLPLAFCLFSSLLVSVASHIAPAQAQFVKNQADTSWVALRLGGVKGSADSARVLDALEKLCGQGTVVLKPDYASSTLGVEVRTRLLVDGNRIAQESG